MHALVFSAPSDQCHGPAPTPPTNEASLSSYILFYGASEKGKKRKKMAAKASEGLLFSFGLCTDLQYADKESNHVESKPRHYRDAINKLNRAIDGFNKETLAFVIHLGDIIDGNTSVEKNEEDLRVVLDALTKLKSTSNVHHVIGNHCLALSRSHLYSALGMSSPYYSFKISTNDKSWRFIVLDSCDISVSWPADSPNHQAAKAWLAANSDAPNAKEWNGGFSQEQLAWLRGQLESAATANESVVVFNHMPISGVGSSTQHQLYNHAEALELLQKSPSVYWYFCGHYHNGGYARVQKLHHVNCEALLEAPTGSTAYAIVDVYPNKLVIRGSGSFSSRELPA